MKKLFSIENTQSGHKLGDYLAHDEQDALDVMARDAGYQDYAVLDLTVPAKPGEILVTETEYFDFARESRIDPAYLLAVVQRNFECSDAARRGLTAEEVIEQGGSDGDTAMDLLLTLLANETDDTENGTLEECCAELARRGLNYESCFGVRVREDEGGPRVVEWGMGDDYTWTSIQSVLEATQKPVTDKPCWFDEDWVEVWTYDVNQECCGYWLSKRTAIEQGLYSEDDE